VHNHRGGDKSLKERKKRPQVIFGAEASEEEHLLTFPGACVSWPILYTSLKTGGMTPEAFKGAVRKRNQITNHDFVYRYWHKGKYRRYPSRPRG
jgi:hypothetical protein